MEASRKSRCICATSYKKISRHVIKVSRTKCEVSGLENIPDEPCVFMANHQGIFDAFLIIAHIEKPFRFIAKREISKIPLIGMWMRDTGTVFINRENIKESVVAINKGIENLQNGYSVIVFPEGTRSKGGDMTSFKKGSMKLALKTEVPIIPVSIEGTYKVLEVGNQVMGHTLKMLVHEAVHVTELSKEEKAVLAISIENIVKSGLEKIKAS